MYVEVSDSTVRTTASSVKASGHFFCARSFFCAMSESVINGARVGIWDIVTRAEHLRFFFSESNLLSQKVWTQDLARLAHPRILSSLQLMHGGMACGCCTKTWHCKGRGQLIYTCGTCRRSGINISSSAIDKAKVASLAFEIYVRMWTNVVLDVLKISLRNCYYRF